VEPPHRSFPKTATFEKKNQEHLYKKITKQTTNRIMVIFHPKKEAKTIKTTATSRQLGDHFFQVEEACLLKSIRSMAVGRFLFPIW
jgi:hypothetical protein